MKLEFDISNELFATQRAVGAEQGRVARRVQRGAQGRVSLVVQLAVRQLRVQEQPPHVPVPGGIRNNNMYTESGQTFQGSFSGGWAVPKLPIV